MFHISMWRGSFRDALLRVRHARPYTAPPEDVDEVNDAELASGIGTPLADAAARSEKLLLELIGLAGELGDRPFKWFVANTTAEALLRNSYTRSSTCLSIGERTVSESERLSCSRRRCLRCASSPRHRSPWALSSTTSHASGQTRAVWTTP